MKKSKISLEQRVKTIFPFLGEDDLKGFLSICQYRVFANKEIIFRAGTTERKAGLILKGVIRGYFVNQDGIEKNTILRVEGTFTSVPEWLFENKPTKYTFESILECEMLIFNLEDIEKQVGQSPAVTKIYLWALKENLSTMLGRIESMIDKNPEERYLDIIEKKTLFVRKAFNKHIANYLGITPVSLSRIVKRLKESSKS